MSLHGGRVPAAAAAAAEVSVHKCSPCLHVCLLQCPDEDFWNGDGANNGLARARATTGQGQSVALARNVMRQNVAQVKDNSQPRMMLALLLQLLCHNESSFCTATVHDINDPACYLVRFTVSAS